jgi:hypothetical protein
MNVLRILAVVVSVLMASSGAYAAAQQCVSTDKDHALKVTIDEGASTIDVNGEKRAVHKPAKEEPTGVIVVSNPYETNQYGQVYISLAKNKEGQMTISQVGVKDNQAKATFILDCK